MIRLNFKRLHEDAILPTKNYSTDAGIDFYALEEKEIYPGNVELIKTGIAWQPEFEQDFLENGVQNHFNIYMKIEDRSGIAFKTPLHVKAGVIDQTYRGEIGIVIQHCGNKLSKLGSHFITIEKGQKIAQGIIYIVPKITVNEINDIEQTDRNEKGFGSTGE